MTKQEWQSHMTDAGFVTRGFRDDPAVKAARQHMADCSVCAARQRTARQNRNRREAYDAMRSLGLKRTAYGWE